MKNNKNNNCNFPNLRFPGFSAPWQKHTLQNLCSEFKSGKGIKAEDVNELGAYPIYGGNGLRGYTSTYNYDGNYVLIGRQGALCGNIRFVTNKNYITEHAIAVAANLLNSTKFLKYLLLKMNLGQYSDQSAQPGLAVNKLLKLNVYIPSIDEQVKIARFLSLIDERIATQNKIIEEYKILKDALVEGMFYPSKRQSSLRLKGHNQQWKQYFLKDVIVNFSHRNKYQIKYPMCSVTNNLGFVPQSEKFEERNMIGEDISSYKIVNKGDFAYNPARINVGSIAKYEGDKPCMISSLYVCFSPKSNMSPEWLRHLLKSQRMIYNYNLFGEGGVRIYLFFPNFGRIKINIPPIEEQENIAEVISTIEQKISVENSVFDNLNTQKSFLLSKMFI